MTKHFRATPLAGGEPIEFGLEDIYSVSRRCSSAAAPNLYYSELGIKTYSCRSLERDEMESWLKDYKIQYKHQGEWFDYE